MRLNLVLIAIVLLASCTSNKGIIGEVHEHADFKVYLEGRFINFSEERFMSTSNNTISNFIHLHDNKGNLIHKHATGIKLGFFFQTMGMQFNSSCFVVNRSSYCSNSSHTLSFYVNGKPNSEYSNYEIKDKDRILITYGNKDEESLQGELDSVTSEACIYSEKCPEKGAPPSEASCVGSGCAAEGIGYLGDE